MRLAKQVIPLAGQLGFSLPYEVSDGVWNLEKLCSECDWPGGPGVA
jgi:hypothetical protein